MRVVLAFGFCVAVATGAGAQTRSPSLPPGMGDAARRQVAALGDSLRREGLPWDLLYDKAAEGALKGARDDRIVQVVRSLAARLRVAGSALGPGAAAGDISAAASALYAGVAPEVLRGMAARRSVADRNASLSIPFTLLADLVSRGISAGEAAASIDTLLAHGARDDDFAQLRGALDADIVAGKSPQEAARDGLDRTLRVLEGRRPPPAPPLH
jgi:hypothetical protein